MLLKFKRRIRDHIAPTMLTKCLYSLQQRLMASKVFRVFLIASVAVVPVAAIRGLIITLAVASDYAGLSHITSVLSKMQIFLIGIIPFLMSVFFSLSWSKIGKRNQVIYIIFTMLSLVIINGMITSGKNFFVGINPILSVMISLYCCLVMDKLTNFTENKKSKTVTHISIFIFIILSVLLAGWVGKQCTSLLSPTIQRFCATLYPKDYIHGLAYEFIRDIFWVMGIHGHYFFQEIDSALLEKTINNISTWKEGHAQLNIISNTFYDVWVANGGSGCTLGLVLCMLFRKTKGYRNLLKTTLPLSLLNMNEPLIYGLPIILNPVMMVPFLLTPAVSFTIAYVATAQNIVPHISHIIGWSTPPLLNVWLATGNSGAAILLHIFIIAVSVVIYYPFFLLIENQTRLSSPYTFSGMALQADGKDSNKHIQEMDKHLTARRNVNKLQKSGFFTVYFQPQISLTSNKITGAEVLLRHKSYSGVITPPIFLQDYELLGLMPDIDYWVLERALRYMRDEHNTIKNIRISLAINISPQTLMDNKLIPFIDRLLSEPIPESLTLELEITESQLLQDPVKVNHVITELKARGIKIALDDFGSGYATLSYLELYSLDKIKLDRTLLVALKQSNGRDFLLNTIDLCRINNDCIVAEGVETRDELDFLKSAGVDQVQGYFFYRPMPSDQFFQVLAQSSQETHSNAVSKGNV